MFGRIFARRMTSLAHPLPTRGAKGKYPVPNDSRYKQLMEKQTFFCADDGRLVWQKTGSDVMLYRLSCVLVAVGTVMTAEVLRRLATPPKNQ